MSDSVSQVPSEAIVSALKEVARSQGGPRSRGCQRALDSLAAAPQSVVSDVLQTISSETPVPLRILEVLGQILLRRGQPEKGKEASEPLSPRGSALVAKIYREAGRDCPVRHPLLRALAAQGTEHSLLELVELLASDPPAEAEQCDLALAPLFQLRSPHCASMFPRLLDALAHKQTACGVLDFANFATRQGLVPAHPAADRLEHLLSLHGSLVQNLFEIERRPEEFAQHPQALGRLVNECVALLSALGDALALIGDPRAIPKLHQALDLNHRRLRAEAAAALARLGDPEGVRALVQLASDPAQRNRVLEYLRQLDKEDQVPPEHRTAQAQAEGHLATWLAEPTHLGAPPHRLSLRDARIQFWPGFSQPVECFLFDFEYQFPVGKVHGVGMAGPVIQALGVKCQDWNVEDIYALYAGWNTEHPEIREHPATDLNPAAAQRVDDLVEYLLDQGYVHIQPVLLGEFLGDDVLLAEAEREGTPGHVICASDRVDWIPQKSSLGQISPEALYAWYKGRALLRAFNPARAEPV